VLTCIHFRLRSCPPTGCRCVRVADCCQERAPGQWRSLWRCLRGRDVCVCVVPSTEIKETVPLGGHKSLAGRFGAAGSLSRNEFSRSCSRSFCKYTSVFVIASGVASQSPSMPSSARRRRPPWLHMRLNNQIPDMVEGRWEEDSATGGGSIWGRGVCAKSVPRSSR
jgi:hypothetical protein